MKARNILAILSAGTLLASALVSCNLGGTTIDQRVSDFQSDLNTADRSSAYQNFSSSMSDYTLLKSGSTFTAAFPLPPPNYTLSVISESNTSAVIVQVSSGPNNVGGGNNPPNCYLNLNMTEESGNNWVIQTLSAGPTSSGGWTVYYQ